ncbi:hypothetical protein M422DRAFT_153810 [Sphaerobolus stellatus SS14]|nr:hypothetical protein M422DRAFT_153810 [Sphaerobolus stellatus SS14]
MESVASSDGHDTPRRYASTSYFDRHAPTSNLPSEHVALISSRPETPSSTGGPRPSSGGWRWKLNVPLPSSGGSIALPYGHPSAILPKAAQNAGGVIGALIATTNNLAGPAAPLPSTIGPDVSRRGFRLVRHPEVSNPPSYSHSEPSTPPPTPVAAAEFSDNLSPHRQSTRRTKLSGWLTEIKPHERVSIKAEKRTPSYEASTRAYEEGKEDAKSYRRARKERRRTAEIYITRHVAEVLQRQEFILKLARALIMFAGPGHRLQAILGSAARVLDLEISSLHLPNVILISFGDPVTSTSNIKFIQQGGALNLEKLLLTQKLYWKVIHDEIFVSSASASLDLLMHSPSRYNKWQCIIFGGLCSSAICSLSFSGSFVDSLVVFPLGALLVTVQLISVKNELYTNVFEITIATFLSFVSAALASSRKFCYAAVASSSVVLILPGFFVLNGSLELAARQITSGAVRICFAVIYALFLGFGLAIGVVIYSRITGLQVVGPDDYTCKSFHDPHGPWWQRPVPLWWAFLTVPLFSLGLSLRNQAPIWRKEMAIIVIIACAGWAANHFSGNAFKNRPDIQSAIGALTVGVVANLYGRFFYGNAYVVMITGILFQLPSGLANGGLLTFAAVNSSESDSSQQFESYEAGFKVAAQLIAVAIGLTVGLFMSVVIVHPLGGSRRRNAALFSL